jgi:hypothetical protein
MSDDVLTIQPPRRGQIAAISSSVQRKPIVVVLGMHRSGTSLCSHLLSALGVDMADKIAGPGNAATTPDNPRGHWERWEIVEFHDRILGLFNRDYLGRFHDLPLPVAWWADPRVAQIRREIVAFLEQRMDEGWFGFKDPRTVRLMPVWQQVFNELKLAPKVVLCLRNPAQIARSLQARDGLDPQIGEYRWLVHMIDFFRYINNGDYCTVEYEAWFDDPSGNFQKLQDFLALRWQQSEADVALVLSGVIDRALRHDGSAQREASQPLVRTLYKLARDADRKREQIAYIVSQFVGFQQLHRPFQQAFEEAGKIAARYPEIAREAARLRATLGERDALVKAAEARAAAGEERLSQALVEIDREASTLKELLADREAALGEALAQARRAEQERAAAAEAMQAEVAALWDTLAQAEDEAQQRDAAMAALAEAERAAQDRADRAEASEAEVRGLREALAQAGREANARLAAAAALQAEITTLQGTLAAARKVGKAAAFAIETAAPPKPDRPRRWRHAVMHLFDARARA